MKKVFLIFFLFVFSSSVGAVELVSDAQVKSVGNTSGNGLNFFVVVSGGTGPCTNQLIAFPQSAAGDISVFNRAYKSALLALSTGMHVKIHNYADSSCVNAAYIEVFSP